MKNQVEIKDDVSAVVAKTEPAATPNCWETVIDLATDTTLYKTYGRTYVSNNGLNIDFAGNGLEFEVECGGEVHISYSGAARAYFQTFVDGEAGIRFCTEVGSDYKVKIAEGQADGVHNIRIIRDTDANKTAGLMAISKVFFTGKKETFKAPEDQDLYIEFVGDSITAGKYTAMENIEGIAIHKATNSYAYQTAKALNADFSVIARGGCGYFRISTCPKTMNQLYPYYNGFAQEPVTYHTARKADVVVLALGTNDGPSNVTESFANGIVPFETYEAALIDQIRQIRGLHGENVKIVLLYGMMTTSWEAEFQGVSTLENTYLLKVTKNWEGGRNHPSAAGHQVIAGELTKYLKENVL